MRAPANAAAVAQRTGTVRQFDFGPALIALVSVCVALLLAWWLAGRFLGPLRAMTTTAQGDLLDQPTPTAQPRWPRRRADRQQAEDQGIHINVALAQAVARGDPSLVESMVTNLIDNAIHHNQAGGSLDISTVTEARRAVLSVSNTGATISPDQVDRLFQPFQRIGTQRVQHTDGHGFGLAIVRAIATAHGATITAHARPHRGLDIEVSFPTTPDWQNGE
jgi:light-regulated signal transduction histidine kinase (bacteriophytochrome)